MEQLGKAMLGFGLLVAVVGGLVWALSGVKGLPFGRLPGDLAIQRGGFSIYAPVASMLVLSLVLSGILTLAGRLFR